MPVTVKSAAATQQSFSNRINSDELTASTRQGVLSDTLDTLTTDSSDREIIKKLHGAFCGDNALKNLMILADIRDRATVDKQLTISVHLNADAMELCSNHTVMHHCPVSSTAAQFIRERCLNSDDTLKDTAELMTQIKQYRAAIRLQQGWREFNALMEEKRAHSRAKQKEIIEQIEPIETLQQQCAQRVQLARQNGSHQLQAQATEELDNTRNSIDHLKSQLEFAKLFTTEYRGRKGGRTYYHDASDEKIKYPPMYAPHQQDKQKLTGSKKKLTHSNRNYVALAPKDDTYFTGKNFRPLARTSGIILNIAVTPDKMIARNGGQELASLKHPIDIRAFEPSTHFLKYADENRWYFLDIKDKNTVYQKGNNSDDVGIVRIIDTEDMVTEDSSDEVFFTARATTKALYRACFIKNESTGKMMINPRFEERDLAENSCFFNAWQQYALAIVIMQSTTADLELRGYLAAPLVDTMRKKYPRERLYPGAMNKKSEHLFQTWMDSYIKPEFHDDYKDLMSNPAQYACRERTDAPYLYDMIQWVKHNKPILMPV